MTYTSSAIQSTTNASTSQNGSGGQPFTRCMSITPGHYTILDLDYVTNTVEDYHSRERNNPWVI